MPPPHDAYRLSIASAWGLPEDVFSRPGTTVVADASRAGTGVVSCYSVGEHALVYCEPDLVPSVAAQLESTTTITLDRFEACFAAGQRLGRGDVHVLTAAPEVPAFDARVLRADDPSDRALIGELVAMDPDGADDAEVEMDALDHHIVGIERGGVLAAYASERPAEWDDRFADVGVLTHPEHRRRGLALTVLGVLDHRVLDSGRWPLYRCNHDNPASKATALAAGFTCVATLSAVRVST